MPYVIGFGASFDDNKLVEVKTYGHGQVSDHARTVLRFVGRAIYDNMDVKQLTTFKERRSVLEKEQPWNYSMSQVESCVLGS